MVTFQLFGLTMAVLLAPKFFGLGLALIDGPVRRACGGAWRLILSCCVEILLSALVAPVAMVIQSGSVIGILLGRDTGWNPQRARRRLDPARRHHRPAPLAHGAGACGRHRRLRDRDLAVPVDEPDDHRPGAGDPDLLGERPARLGLALKRRGLLATPEEVTPPEIALRAGRLSARNAEDGLDEADALAALAADPELAEAHTRMLPPACPARAARSTPTRRSRPPRSARRNPWPKRRLGSLRRSAWPCCMIGRSSTVSAGWGRSLPNQEAVSMAGSAYPAGKADRRGPAGALFCLILLAGSPVDAAPRPDGTQRFTASYGLSFLNLGVGKADLTADLTSERYALVLGGGLSGLAGWFFQGSGSARSSGRLSPTGHGAGRVPDRQHLRHHAGPRARRLRVPAPCARSRSSRSRCPNPTGCR